MPDRAAPVAGADPRVLVVSTDKKMFFLGKQEADKVGGATLPAQKQGGGFHRRSTLWLECSSSS